MRHWMTPLGAGDKTSSQSSGVKAPVRKGRPAKERQRRFEEEHRRRTGCMGGLTKAFVSSRILATALLVSALSACGGSAQQTEPAAAGQPDDPSVAPAETAPADEGETREDVSPEVRTEAHALYNLALQLKRSDQLEQALVEIDKAIAIHPGFAAAHFTRGSVLKGLGRLPGATEAFRQARVLKPTHQNAWAMEGATLVRQSEYEEAVEPLRRAVDMSGKDADSVMNLGIALKNLNRFDEAVAVYERGLRDMPGNPGILNNLAILLSGQKRYEETIVYLEDALKADPENAELLLNMATTLRQAERHGEAIAYYERVIAAQPNNTGALYDLGFCYEREGRPKDAIRAYQQYVKAIKDKDPAAAKRTSDLIKRMQ